MYYSIFAIGAFIILFFGEYSFLQTLEFEFIWALLHLIFYKFPIIYEIVMFLMCLSGSLILLIIIDLTAFSI